jgi:hypothetical protein
MVLVCRQKQDVELMNGLEFGSDLIPTDHDQILNPIADHKKKAEPFRVRPQRKQLNQLFSPKDFNVIVQRQAAINQSRHFLATDLQLLPYQVGREIKALPMRTLGSGYHSSVVLKPSEPVPGIAHF